jgi:hypothetical protein
MAELASLIQDLQKKAAISPTETPFDEPFLTGLIGAALLQHNSSYTSVDLLPVVESPLVVLLAWIQVCVIRAGIFAKESDISGAGGYGQDRNTPFYKCKLLMETLKVQYDTLYDSIVENETKGGDIVVSNLIVTSDLIDVAIPLAATSTPIVAALYEESRDEGAGEIILRWVTADSHNFVAFVFLHAADVTIVQAWNQDSATTLGIAGINDATTVSEEITNSKQRSAKLVGIDFTKTNHFVLATRSYGDNYSFSNELVIAATA